MKKGLFLLLLLPLLAFGHPETVVSEVFYKPAWISRAPHLALSDGTTWKVIDDEGFDLALWDAGHHICFYRPDHFKETEFRIINVDLIACIKAKYAGRR